MATSKRAPPEGDSPTLTVPPCWVTAWATMASPRPDPGCERAPAER